MTIKGKIIATVTGLIAIGIAAFILIKFYFVFGEGVKAGELNQVVYKGYIFKTYEGRLIQSGLRGTGAKGTVTMESYVFEFSVDDQGVADSLMRCSGKNVELQGISRGSPLEGPAEIRSGQDTVSQLIRKQHGQYLHPAGGDSVRLHFNEHKCSHTCMGQGFGRGDDRPCHT